MHHLVNKDFDNIKMDGTTVKGEKKANTGVLLDGTAQAQK